MTQKTYGNITIFTAKKVTDKHPDYNGKIKITEAILPGEYECSLFNAQSEKTGLKYIRGQIKDPWRKPEEKKEWEPNSESDLYKPKITVISARDFLSKKLPQEDDIPF